MKAKCGHEIESYRDAPRSCGAPRCTSGLPLKFTDRECAAYMWLVDRGGSGWIVDLLTKKVHDANGREHADLIEKAARHGWDG